MPSLCNWSAISFCLRHGGFFVFQTKALVEIDHGVAHPGIGHAWRLDEVGHLGVALRLVVEVVAAAQKKIERLVREPNDVRAQFLV